MQKVGDSYYMYYQRTVIGTQLSNISVASSPDMSAGSWTDHGILPIPRQTPQRDYNRIDANLLVVEGQDSDAPELYMCFGSFWDNIFSLRMTRPITLEPDTFSHLELNVTTYNPGEFNTGRNPSEGAYQFAWPLDEECKTTSDTQYYLFWSSGNCCNTTEFVPTGNEYKIMVCRSPSPTGPFIDRDGRSCASENGGTLILGTHDNVYAPGGQGVMFDQGLERVIIYYHYRQ